MARREAEREDLMHEATALAERIELSVVGESHPIVAGFRRDGRFSLFFGEDPAFHFDAEGKLRRAFAAGLLYRSRGDTLSRLTRNRTETATELLRYDLLPEELSDFQKAMQKRIDTLMQSLDRGEVVIVRQVSDAVDLLERVRRILPLTMSGEVSPALRQ